eukprot:2233428-Alexandrium_andersonii.AAC.1
MINAEGEGIMQKGKAENGAEDGFEALLIVQKSESLEKHEFEGIEQFILGNERGFEGIEHEFEGFEHKLEGIEQGIVHEG